MHRRILLFLLLVLAFPLIAAHPVRGEADEVRSHIEALASPDAVKRLHAAIHLNILGAKAKEAVPALVKALSDESEFVRMWCVLALGKMAPESKVAVPKLEELAEQDPNRIVRDNAGVVMKKLSLEPRPLFDPLPVAQKVVGRWRGILSIGEHRLDHVLSFAADGTMESTVTSTEGRVNTARGTWKRSGDTLEFKLKGIRLTKLTITWLGPDRFSTLFEDTKVIYERKE